MARWCLGWIDRFWVGCWCLRFVCAFGLVVCVLFGVLCGVVAVDSLCWRFAGREVWVWGVGFGGGFGGF